MAEKNEKGKVVVSGVVSPDNRELMPHGTDEFRMSAHVTRVHPGMGLALFYHWHEELEFFYLVKGQVSFCMGNQIFKVSSGEIVIVPPRMPHMAYRDTEDDIEFYAVLTHIRFLSSQENDLIQNRYIYPVFLGWKNIPFKINQQMSGHADIEEEIRSIMTLYQSAKDGYELLIKSSLYRILYFLVENMGSTQETAENCYADAWIRKMLYFIQNNFQQRLTLHEMANHVSMSESYFCRSVKRVFQVSPMELLNQYRVTQAAAMIEGTDKKLGDIAFDSGFPNVNRFTEVFKKVMHCTPLEYRQRIKKQTAGNERTKND